MKIPDFIIEGFKTFGAGLLVNPPRFERLSVWLGGLAETAWRGSRYFAIPIGPFVWVLRWLYLRKQQALFSRMPWHERIILAGTVGVTSMLVALVKKAAAS